MPLPIPISGSAIQPYPLVQYYPRPSLASLPVWLPPEIREEIENQLDQPAWQNFFKALTIVTNKGEPIDSPVLKLHLLQQKVPREYQHDLARPDMSLRTFAFNQLKILWKSGQLDQVVERPALFELLQLVGGPALFRFLQERIEEDPELEQKLLNWVKHSKTEEVQPIAANAFTLLVKADVDMSGQDFKGIRVPGADLSGGQFDHAQFEGADLSHVNFRRARLRGANLQKAELAGINFGELPTIQGSEFNACCYSPDGRWLAVCTGNGWEIKGEVQLYHTETLELVHTLKGPSEEPWGTISKMIFSPDSKFLAWSSEYWQDTVKLWRIGSAEEWHTLEGHRGGVRSMAFSPDSKVLASGNIDQTVTLWKVENKEKWHTLLGHTDKVNSVKFSPNGKLLASGSRDATVKLWNVESAEEVHTFERHTYKVNSVDFSPNGEFLVSSSEDHTVRLWSVKSGEQLHALEWQSYCRGHIVNFSPNGEFLASFHHWIDGIIKLWRVDNGEVWKTLEGHSSKVLSVDFSRDGKLLASGSRDGTVKLWSLESGEVLHTFKAHGKEVAWVNFSPDNKTLAWRMGDVVKLRRMDDLKNTSYWGPSQNKLKVTNVSIQGAQGLSSMNQLLLKQKGAHGEPAPAPAGYRSAMARMADYQTV